jgi:two-component system, chemotaxis family, chemotaxis protein CheY
MPKTIIVIDDSQVIREQVSIVLKQAGYDVVEAEDGVEGAAAIRNHPAASLAICDVNMPKLGGLEMLESLRASSTATALPIIMLTTEGRPDLIERARASGAKGWMVKPFKPTMLLAAVKKIAGEAA